MLILTPENPLFNYDECKRLYEENRHLLDDNSSFEELLQDIHFYSFFDGDRFLGCIYFYLNDNKVFVNAVAKDRHTHLKNIECFKKVLSLYSCDIYANSKLKTSILCLLRCGFKKIAKNLYKYERISL